MHDLNFIRENPEDFDKLLIRRGEKEISKVIIDMDKEHREIQTKLQNAQKSRNEIAKSFGIAKKNGQSTDELSKKAELIKSEISTLSEKDKDFSEKLKNIISDIPNLPQEDVPEGLDESGNQLKHKFGDPKSFDFKPKEHFELGEDLDGIDFERAVKISGSRFVVLKGQIAKLERALASFMIDIHTQSFGFKEVSVPLMASTETMYNTGLLPKFKDDLFQLTRGDWLIPTSEAILSNLYSNEILTNKDLPIRLTSYTPCFRSEAGSAGRDTRGMIRLHQFNKVELVSITTAEKSKEEHEYILNASETILKKLEIPYRVMLLCTGDMGFQSSKTYDIEAWLPGQNEYREISSISNCLDFQTRRMKTRYKLLGDKKNHFAHTLNGSGLAVGRTIVALLENHQNEDGSINIPEALRPYMGNNNSIK